MTVHNPTNHAFAPEAKLASLSWGCQADWYIPANVDACKASVPGEHIGNKMWPRGWFAIVSFTNHDEMRDFGVNQRCERVVAGPFASEAEALAVAEENFGAVAAQLA